MRLRTLHKTKPGTLTEQGGAGPARTTYGPAPGENADRGSPGRRGRAPDEWLLRLDSNYGGLLLLHFTERVEFTTTQLIVWFMLVLLTIAFDYLLPIWGVKKWNGSRWGNWGCVVGTLAGVFFFPPWGILIGPFVGAIAGELLLGRRHIREAVKSGFGAFVGFLLGTICKIGVCGWFIYCFIAAFF